MNCSLLAKAEGRLLWPPSHHEISGRTVEIACEATKTLRVEWPRESAANPRVTVLPDCSVLPSGSPPRYDALDAYLLLWDADRRMGEPGQVGIGGIPYAPTVVALGGADVLAIWRVEEKVENLRLHDAELDSRRGTGWVSKRMADGSVFPAGTLLTSGRWNLRELNGLHVALSGDRRLFYSVEEAAVELVAPALAGSSHATLWHPKLGVAIVPWSAETVTPDMFGNCRIAIPLPEGGRFSGAVSIWNSWPEGKTATIMIPQGIVRTELEGEEDLAFRGILPGVYRVRIDGMVRVHDRESRLRLARSVTLNSGSEAIVAVEDEPGAPK